MNPLKVLARIEFPLLIWMAIGWALFPFGYVRLASIAGEPPNPMIYVISWIFAGLSAVMAAVAYIYSRMPDRVSVLPVEREWMICPYCQKKIPDRSSYCPYCSRKIPW